MEQALLILTTRIAELEADIADLDDDEKCMSLSEDSRDFQRQLIKVRLNELYLLQGKFESC